MEIKNGIDIESVSRFEGLILKASFTQGVYTEKEVDYILSSNNHAKSAASCFSAKEAAAKALGRGLYGLKPNEIEIYHEVSGAPCVRLLGSALSQYGDYAFTLSISYKDDYVVTSCIAYK